MPQSTVDDPDVIDTFEKKKAAYDKGRKLIYKINLEIKGTADVGADFVQKSVKRLLEAGAKSIVGDGAKLLKVMKVEPLVTHINKQSDLFILQEAMCIEFSTRQFPAAIVTGDLDHPTEAILFTNIGFSGKRVCVKAHPNSQGSYLSYRRGFGPHDDWGVNVSNWRRPKKEPKKAKLLTWPRERCSTLRMGNGKGKPCTVIDDGIVKDYVGIGWIEIREATAADKKKYPTLV